MHDSASSARMLEAILASGNDAIVAFACDGTIHTWSKAAESLYGYTASEMLGQPFSRLLLLWDVSAHESLLREMQSAQPGPCERAERQHKKGTRMRIELRRTPIRGERGEIAGILESSRLEMTHFGSNTLEESQFRECLKQVPFVLWTADRALRITSDWGSRQLLPKSNHGDAIGWSVFDYLRCSDPHTSPAVQHYEALRGLCSRFEYTRGGRVLEVHVAPLRDRGGEIAGCIGAGLDVTERKKSEEHSRYQATHDALTGLANYREFLETLEREVRRAERGRRGFAVLLLDLDDLKRVNDRLGHLAGNRALKRLAAVMKENCRETDLAARYGGDEFAVLLIDADRAMARHVAERIEAGLRRDEEQPALTVSIGASVYPDEGSTAQQLLEVADQQLYGRKKKVHSRSA